MRGLLFPSLLAAALALPAASTAGTRAQGDGTLSVRGGKGIVAIAARGGVIGRFERGCVRISDPVEDDGSGPIVYGAERIRDLSETDAIYCGKDVRFRLIGGFFRLRTVAYGTFLSAVGQGSVTLGPAERFGGESAGEFSLNGEEYRPFPDTLRTFRLGASLGG